MSDMEDIAASRAFEGMQLLSFYVPMLIAQRDSARIEAEDYRDEAYKYAINGGTCNEWRRQGKPKLPWENKEE